MSSSLSERVLCLLIYVSCFCNVLDMLWMGIYLQNATQKSQNVFVHVPSEIAAHEVEEIGTTPRLIFYSLVTICFTFKNSTYFICLNC